MHLKRDFQLNSEPKADSPELGTELDSALSNYLAWLLNPALQHWSSNGIDASGGAIERFHYSGEADRKADRRVRVQHRQIVVFSLAHTQGWLANGDKLVAGIQAYLDNSALLEPPLSSSACGVYAHTLNASNEVADRRQDLYDLAFQLLALACCHHAFGDDLYLRQAESLFKRIQTQFANPHGGWVEGDYKVRHRRQNPHMHMFEAMLMLYQTSADARWLRRAEPILVLFLTRFYQAEQHVVMEFFNADWTEPQDIQSHCAIEPGHMFEWVWLLRQYQAVSGFDVDDVCNRLYHRALAIGCDPHKVIYQRLNGAGIAVDASKRNWPMTEWIKASLSQASFASDRLDYNYADDALAALQSLQKNFLKHPVAGQYIDCLDSNNQAVKGFSQASSLYHFMMCALEVKRYQRAGGAVLTSCHSGSETEQ